MLKSKGVYDTLFRVYDTPLQCVRDRMEDGSLDLCDVGIFRFQSVYDRISGRSTRDFRVYHQAQKRNHNVCRAQSTARYSH